MMKVQSLHSLGKNRLEFGDPYPEGDLTYIELKVRSEILGEHGQVNVICFEGQWRYLRSFPGGQSITVHFAWAMHHTSSIYIVYSENESLDTPRRISNPARRQA